jgi:DNA-binding LacI/PurR family transcriptional regulator
MKRQFHRNGRRGVDKARRITARDVAKAVGLSTMTVSRALNGRPHVDDDTRARVFKVARKLGYSPNDIAKSLALNKTNTIGVVVPEISHSFFPEAIRGIEDATYSAGYHVILMHSAEISLREQDAIQTLGSRRVDGLLISTAQDITDTRVYEELIKVGVPVVFFDRCIRGIGATCVSIDDEQSSYVATEHLLRHGYTRIGHLAGPIKISVGRERLEGFRRALSNYDIPFDEKLIVESGFHESGGYTAMNVLLNMPPEARVNAVVAVNDPAAFGAMNAVLDRGLSIPDDVAIVGFSDDIRAPLMAVPLTTVRQPAYALGKLAAERLIAAIAQEQKEPEELVVKTELVIRSSCGCGRDQQAHLFSGGAL